MLMSKICMTTLNDEFALRIICYNSINVRFYLARMSVLQKDNKDRKLIESANSITKLALNA